MRVGGGVANIEDDAGVVVGGILAGDDGLAAKGVHRLGIAVAPEVPSELAAISEGSVMATERAGGSADSGSGRRGEEVRARVAVQIVPAPLHRIDGVGDARRQSVELGLDGGNLLIAGLDRPAQLAGSDGTGDVVALRIDFVQSGGIQLGLKLKALLSADQGRAVRGGKGKRVAGWDYGNVDQRGELVDGLLALVDKGSGALPHILQIADLGVELGDLLRELVDLTDRCTTLRSRLVCCWLRLFAVALKLVARLPAAVSTPWRTDKSEGSVESWLMLSKKFDIAVPISSVLLAKLVCVCCRAEARAVN